MIVTALRSSYHTNRCKSIPQALTIYMGGGWGYGKPQVVVVGLDEELTLLKYSN